MRSASARPLSPSALPSSSRIRMKNSAIVGLPPFLLSAVRYRGDSARAVEFRAVHDGACCRSSIFIAPILARGRDSAVIFSVYYARDTRTHTHARARSRMTTFYRTLDCTVLGKASVTDITIAVLLPGSFYVHADTKIHGRKFGEARERRATSTKADRSCLTISRSTRTRTTLAILLIIARDPSSNSCTRGIFNRASAICRNCATNYNARALTCGPALVRKYDDDELRLLTEPRKCMRVDNFRAASCYRDESPSYFPLHAHARSSIHGMTDGWRALRYSENISHALARRAFERRSDREISR